MNLDSGGEKTWLVKSAGLILGPFSLEEVIEALREKKISIVDEVRTTSGRWSFIREHQEFSQIIQLLRDQRKATKEDTETINAITQTVTNTANAITPITANILTKTKEEALPDLTAQAVEVLEAAHTRNEGKPVLPSSTYAYKSDQKVQNNLSAGRSRTVRVAWIILGLVVLGLMVLPLLKQKELPRSLGYEDYLRLAKSNKGVGQLDNALDFYRKAESIRPLQASSRLQMVTLMMLVENQNVQARQYFEKINKNLPDDRTKDEVEKVLALSYLREGQLEEAQKRYETLWTKDSKNEAIKMNLAEISILKGQFESAYSRLTELLKEGVKEDTLTLYRTLASYRMPAGKGNDDKLLTSLLDLKRYLAKTQDFKMEALLLIAAIQTKLGNTLDVGVTFREILNTNPDLTKDHIHDEMLHREILEWNYLGQICELTLKAFPISSYPMGLRALCLYQQADMKSALEQIDRARNQFGSDPILFGLQAFLLVKSGRSSEASAIWRLPRADESDLLIAVHARLCMEQKDWVCAETQWQKLLTKQSNSVEALYGLARVSAENGKKERALDFIQQGLIVSKNYRPLVILKDQINEF